MRYWILILCAVFALAAVRCIPDGSYAANVPCSPYAAVSGAEYYYVCTWTEIFQTGDGFIENNYEAMVCSDDGAAWGAQANLLRVRANCVGACTVDASTLSCIPAATQW